MHFFAYRRDFIAHCFTDKTLFHLKAGSTPQDVIDINNCPRSYSLNDTTKAMLRHFTIWSSNNYIFLCGCQDLQKSRVYLLLIRWPPLYAETFQMRQSCNGPCISLSFLSTQSSTFLERAGIFSRWTDTDFFLFFGFALLNTMACANYFCILLWLDKLSWCVCLWILIPENVVESEQSNDRQESLCHCEGLLICFLKEISQK